MVCREKKSKVCDKVSEDRISDLPEHLICDILCHLFTEVAVTTSVLSTRWRNLWRCVPGLDLDSATFSNSSALVSFVERFFDSQRESWIRKLRLNFSHSSYSKSLVARWIDVVITRRIQHLYVNCLRADEMPVSLYTCETLVHLRLCGVTFCDAEFVALPCLKILHLKKNRYPNMTMLQKLISGSPVLEDLTIRSSNVNRTIQVRSRTVKRIDIHVHAEVVIDAPLLQCLRTRLYSEKNFQIINSCFPAKLDIAFPWMHVKPGVIRDILTDIAKVRDLAIGSNALKEFFLYSESRPVHQFRNLSHLNVRFYISDLEMLPTILESCTKLESLILDVKNEFMQHDEEKREPNVRFSAVPSCLVSSLKFVELKRRRLIPRYEGEVELVRYFLKNSTILEKLRLNVYYSEKAKCAFLTELFAMTRCSSACKVIVL